MIRQKQNRFFLILLGIVFLKGLTLSAQETDIRLKIDTCWNKQMESVYLHLPQKSVVAGDNLFFRAYLLNTYPKYASKVSSIIYFDIVAPNGEIIRKWKSDVVNNTCSGKLTIPDTLSSGIYSIRSYTNWMLNIGNDFIYQKSIFIKGISSEKSNVLKKQSKDTIVSSAIILSESNIKVEVISKIEKDKLLVSFRSGDQIKYFNILVVLNGEPVEFKSLAEITGELHISLKNRKSGIVYVLVVDSGSKVIAQTALPYIRKENATLYFEELDELYKAGENIAFQLILKNDQKFDSGSFSCSVTRLYDLSFLQESPTMDEYFGLYSKLPSSYLNSYALDNSAINTYYGNLSWHRSPWGLSSNIEGQEYRYAKELESVLLSGKLSYKNTGQPLVEIPLSLSIRASVPNVKFTSTTNSGIFYFWLDEAFNNRELYLKIDRDSIRSEEVSWEFKTTNPSIKNSQEEKLYVTPTDREMINEIGQLYMVSSFYNNTIPKLFIDSLKHKSFIQYPSDYICYPKEYSELKSFQDIVNNILPLVNLKQIGNSFSIEIVNPETKTKYSNPLVLVDGIPYTDLSILASFPADEIEKVSVWNSIIFHGNFTFFGILNIQTVPGTMSSNKAIVSAEVIHNNVLKSGKEIYQTVRLTEKHKPNFDGLLYWNSEINLNSEQKVDISFPASELPGKYRIRVEGLTLSGKSLSVSKHITIE